MEMTRSCDSITMLRRAIDPGRIQPLIERQGERLAAAGEHLLGCTVHRLFPRGDDRYVIKYLLEVEDRYGRRQTRIVFGEIAAGDSRKRRERLVEKLRKSRRGQLAKREKPSGSGIEAIPELNMVVIPAGYDVKLPGLILHHQPRRAHEFLTCWAPGSGAGERPVTSELLNHRPGKRCILRLQQNDTGRSVVVRCLRPGEGRMTNDLETLDALRQAGLRPGNPRRVQVPRPLGGNPALAAVAIEEIPACNLQEAVEWDEAHKARIAATALAEFHALDLRPTRRYGVNEELTLLDRWVQLVTRLRPELRPAVTTAWEAVQAKLMALSPPLPALIHRDFYPKQVLYDGSQITLLDFDTISLGDPALDLGNHLAHQQMSAIHPADSDQASTIFLETYAEARPLPDAKRIAAWRDAASLRLVCLYAARTGWTATAEDWAARIAR